MPVTKKQKIDDDRSPLWKLVTEIPDLFRTEILTKFDEIDLKIFYDLCRASRAVVIRSKIELNNEERDVSDVESIRELEIAWEHYRFGEKNMRGRELTQEWFCSRVAQADNLDYLKWAREVKQCAWGSRTISIAASQGDLEMVKYCVENDCPMDWKACSNAAHIGHLDVLKYLHEHGCPWNGETLYWALKNDHNDCFEYAMEQECPGCEEYDPEHPDYDPPDFSDYEDEDESEESEHPDYQYDSQIGSDSHQEESEEEEQTGSTNA
jgi:hypothetical protein